MKEANIIDDSLIQFFQQHPEYLSFQFLINSYLFHLLASININCYADFRDYSHHVMLFPRFMIRFFQLPKTTMQRCKQCKSISQLNLEVIQIQV